MNLEDAWSHQRPSLPALPHPPQEKSERAISARRSTDELEDVYALIETLRAEQNNRFTIGIVVLCLLLLSVMTQLESLRKEVITLATLHAHR